MFSLRNENYILVVDYLSGDIEVEKLSNESTESVISYIKRILLHHGTPNEMISDYGPQYSSYKFAEFASKWDFKHLTSSSYYPKAERAVQTMKKIIKKKHFKVVKILI